MHSKWLWGILPIISITLFMNCAGELTPVGKNSKKSSNNLNSASGNNSRMGVILGFAVDQAFVDQMPSVGGWYYRYRPHPNSVRLDGIAANTVEWANTNNKEFVPMIPNLNFEFAPGKGTCSLTPEVVSTNQNQECKTEDLISAMLEMKALFNSSNQPQYLITFNEPYKTSVEVGAATGPMITVAQAIKAWSKVQTLAQQSQLKIVSPSTSMEASALDWTAQFLKSCHDLGVACNLDLIEAFNVHEYQCDSNYWEANYIQKGFQKALLSRLKSSNGQNYGGRNWDSFVMSRKIWVTETTCNWDPDFQASQKNNMYVRSNTEACLRATGQREGFGSGSLSALMEADSSQIARFAWWTSHLDPLVNTDVGVVNESSKNRIYAARMFDDFYQLTPVGRAYLSVMEDGVDPATVDCYGIERFQPYWQCAYSLKGEKGNTWNVIRKTLFDDNCVRSTYNVKLNNPKATVSSPVKIFVGLDNGLKDGEALAHRQASIMQCRYELKRSSGTYEVYRNSDIDDNCAAATAEVKKNNPAATISKGPTEVWVSRDDGLADSSSASHFHAENIECHFDLTGAQGSTWSVVRVTDQLDSQCSSAVAQVKANNPNATVKSLKIIYTALDQ